jgi:pyruvate dehydrogenase E2 component (dihydrolipoamide acetyltransferase)
MPTPVLMPQMGESIAEGTIVRWIKKIGDHVDRDEPLFEISTDKVDAEIPSPAAGVLVEIRVKEGETVPVESVVAAIGLEEETLEETREEVPSSTASTAADLESGAPELGRAAAPIAVAGAPAGSVSSSAFGQRATEQGAPETHRQQDATPRRPSPLVRRLAREHNVDVSRLSGTGLSGRVTKADILRVVEGSVEGGGVEGTPAGGASVRRAISERPEAGPVPVAAFQRDDRVETRPLSAMRRKIAEHMVLSRRTSAHVHTVFHVNFSRVESIRRQKKAAYEQAGAKLTYMTFIAKACVDALRRYPLLNASLDGENVVLKKDINLGIAVSIESGLIVPVIKQADEKNMLGLSRAIVDVADRARTKRLAPDEVHGGTFTITNPGQLGAQFGLPIINQPQVAILGVGTIEKRPVVVDDAIAIRTMAYLALGFDHRLIDGAVADQFMADIKGQLESFEDDQA